MGPCKAMEIKRKISIGESLVERSLKQRNDWDNATTAQTQPQPVILMVNRLVTTGQNINFEFLEVEPFQFKTWIQAQGWERFCMLEVPIYPMLVRSFFENLRIGTVSTSFTIKNVLIVLDERWIGNILEMSRNGICFLTLERKINYLKVMLERDDIRNLKNL